MQLTPEQINEFIAKQILESTIGQSVQDAVKRTLEALHKSYDNPFDQVIRSHVMAILNEEVLTQYRPVLEEGIKKALAAHMTDEVVKRIIDAAMEKLRSRY